MGFLVRVLTGEWSTSDGGIWSFDEDPSDMDHYVPVKTYEEVGSLTSLVREELGIRPQTPMVLTYQLPPHMLLPHGSPSQPTVVRNAEDVEILMSIYEWTNDVQLCVTYGSCKVAKFQFMCRDPFTIGETTYSNEGISEEDHLTSIIERVEDDEFDFTELGEIFSEKSLVLVYRLSFENDKARNRFNRNVKPHCEDDPPVHIIREEY